MTVHLNALASKINTLQDRDTIGIVVPHHHLYFIYSWVYGLYWCHLKD